MRTQKEKNEYSRQYYQNNILKIRSQHLEYQKRNRESLNRWARTYRRTPEGFFKHVEKMAKRRGVEFELTKDRFIVWLSKQNNKCSYCQRELEGNKEEGTSQSVDRMNSKKGYQWNNIVLACELCNRAKNKYLSFEEMKRVGGVIRKIMKERNVNNQGD